MKFVVYNILDVVDHIFSFCLETQGLAHGENVVYLDEV